MAPGLRKRFGERPAEALFRNACGSDVTRRLRKAYGATPAVAIWR